MYVPVRCRYDEESVAMRQKMWSGTVWYRYRDLRTVQMHMEYLLGS